MKKYTQISSPVRRVHAGAMIALAVLITWASVATPLAALAATAPKSDLYAAQPDSLERLEIPKNGWLAAGEAAGLNILLWGYNRYIREGGTNPGFRIGIDTWEENIKNGFEWDDNSFSTNQFAHPYHGNIYFNAARSNGFGYWGSLPFAFGGSFMWEYFMENHHPSYNDWIATSIGGAAIGEATHRLSALIWDNTARGSSRTWKEIGGFLVNPMGGFNRLISGRSNKIYANPEEKYPTALRSNVEFGLRTIGEEKLSNADTTRAYFRADFYYGNPFEGDIEKPYETFEFGVQVNFGDKTALAEAQIKGLLMAGFLKDKEGSQHMLALVQHFDYVNNNAYELGGQSVSASYLGRMGQEKSAFLAEFHGDAVIMGGTKSDYENFTGRSYDYGPGLGFKFNVAWHRNGRPFLSLGHSSHWLTIVNGDEATHYLALTKLRLKVRLRNIFGLGAELAVYHAERKYRDFEDVSQVNPEARLFLNWIAF